MGSGFSPHLIRTPSRLPLTPPPPPAPHPADPPCRAAFVGVIISANDWSVFTGANSSRLVFSRQPGGRGEEPATAASNDRLLSAIRRLHAPLLTFLFYRHLQTSCPPSTLPPPLKPISSFYFCCIAPPPPHTHVPHALRLTFHLLTVPTYCS